MGQVHQLSHDYFAVNRERSDIWAELFCDKNKTTDWLLSFYSFSSQDEAFADIADFIYSRWKCVRWDNNLSKSILIFTDHMKESDLFSEEDILDVKQVLNKLWMSGYKYIETDQEIILKKVISILEEDRNKLQELYDHIWNDSVIKH